LDTSRPAPTPDTASPSGLAPVRVPARDTAILDAIAGFIVERGLVPGDRLPPERELARRLRVSRMTLRQALHALEQRGLVSRRVGREGGTFVAEPKLELSGLAALSDQLRGLGRQAGARVLSAVERRPAPAEAAALGSSLGVFEIVRVRSADDIPVALERTVLPAEVFPGILDAPLDGSLYALMRERYGVSPVRAVERLEPALAGKDDAVALGIAPGLPLMRVERVTYAGSGRAVELSRDLFRGDRTRVVWETEIAGALPVGAPLPLRQSGVATSRTTS
jgi:GntR family transcriptional regulator